MAHYTSIRGWLQVSTEMIPEIDGHILAFKMRAGEYDLTPESADLYLQGFVLRKEQINWSNYVFYGADIRTSAVRFIEDLIKEIAERVFEKDDDYTDYPFGLFHVNSEDEDEMIVWLANHGTFTKLKTDYPFT